MVQVNGRTLPRNGAPAIEGSPRMVIARPISPGDRDEPKIKPSMILNAIRRWWAIALPIGLLLATGGAIAGWFALVPKYRAAAYLIVDSKGEKLAFDTAEGTIDSRGFGLYKSTQMQLLKTPFVLNAALRAKDVGSIPEIRIAESPLQYLQESLTVSFPGGGEIMEVALETENPKSCISLVNAVVHAYMDEVVATERNGRLQRVDSLERVYGEYESKLRARQAELKKVAEALGTGDTNSLTVAQESALQQYGLMQEKLAQIQFELMKATGELRIAQEFDARRKEFEAKRANELLNSSKEIPFDKTPDIVKLEDEVTLAQGKLESISATAGSTHPAVVRAKRELKMRQELLQRHVTAAREKARQAVLNAATEMTAATGDENLGKDMQRLIANVETLTNQEKIMQEKVDLLSAETRELGKSSIDLEVMRSEIENLQLILRRLGEERERTNVELQTASRVSLSSEAEQSFSTIGKKRIAIAGALGVMGLMLPWLFVFAIDLPKKKVDEVEAVSSTLPVSVLGNIPRINGNPVRDRSRVSHEKAKSGYAQLFEAIDSLASMILHRADHEGTRVIMITSAVPGEGKSSISCQVARSLARAGKRVALVDFDLRRPKVASYTGIAPGPGVSDLLSGLATIDEMPTELNSRLTIIQAGDGMVNLHELSTCGVLDQLFENLRAEFDLVIVDSCPLLPVVDSRIVGRHVDGVILSMMRDVSRLPLVSQAYALLKSFSISVLGLVLIGGTGGGYGSRGYYYNYHNTRESAPRLEGRKPQEK